MRFIRKKNFLEGEVLLASPKLHWFYIIKPLLISLPFLIFLLMLWSDISILAAAAGFLSLAGVDYLFNALFRNILLTFGLIVLIITILRIIAYLNIEFGITNKRLIIKQGALRISATEIPTDRIEGLSCYQGIFARIFNYGTIYVWGIGGSERVFFMVSRPFSIRRKIADVIEKNKRITVVNDEFPKPPPAAKPKRTAEEEPAYLYGNFVRVLRNNR